MTPVPARYVIFWFNYKHFQSTHFINASILLAIGGIYLVFPGVEIPFLLNPYLMNFENFL